MKPKFTTENKANALHVTEKYLCNGHWLVARDAIGIGPKKLSEMANMVHGRYSYGQLSGNAANLEALIPDMKGYSVTPSQPTRVEFNGDEIKAYVFKTLNGEEIGINPGHIPVLRMGDELLAKDKLSPMVAMRNNRLVALVMPMRLAAP